LADYQGYAFLALFYLNKGLRRAWEVFCFCLIKLKKKTIIFIPITNNMFISLKKFGSTLTSRDDGKEALAAFQSSLKSVSAQEEIEINFSGVNTFSPAWADEFLTPLFEFFQDRLVLMRTANLSVKATIDLLEKIHNIKFRVK